MKKLYTFLILAFTVAISNAQIIYFPNANFKARLLYASPTQSIAFDAAGTKIKIDANSNGEIEVSEALLVYKLYVSSAHISDMTGIENFTNLREFDCSTNLEMSSLTLSTLVNLEILNVRTNHLTSLLLSNMPNLIKLDCTGNFLTSLTLISFPNLQEISCASNGNLSTLNIADLPALINLDCGSDNLSTLDVSSFTNLQFLVCAQNHLSTLEVNNLTALRSINCYLNNLSELNVSNLINLEWLTCSNNNLQTIDVSNSPHMSTFNCQSNNISSIFVKNGYNYTVSATPYPQTYTLFNNPLIYVCADENKIEDLVNHFLSGFPSSAPTINSYCSFVPGGPYNKLLGNITDDYNNNGCDAGDYGCANCKISITDGTNTGIVTSTITGTYDIPVSTGTYNYAPVFESPTYFNVSPATATVTFPTTTSPFVQDFCVTANGVHNDLEVIVLPFGGARPGFDATYKIIYKNKGTSTQSGTVSLDFYDPIMDLISTTPSFSSQATNTLNWNFSNLIPFETREIEVVFNLNSPVETPAINAGNLLTYTATVTGAADETTADNTSVLTQSVVNSFDPNDKTCTEGNLLPVNEVGKYVHYIIRFENTGSANAENIVVKDMIDTTKYDINSLVSLSGSAAFSTRITNTNKVEFIFQNINLPFDNANNDGYVAFKIKTKATLVEGDTFTNSANIYFDYNAPIVTDPYTTLVFNPLATADFDFNSVFSLSPVPTKNVLTITSKQVTVITSANIYNTLGQLVQVITNPNETIDVSGLKTGSYFIKIISDKGTASSKFIKE